MNKDTIELAANSGFCSLAVKTNGSSFTISKPKTDTWLSYRLEKNGNVTLFSDYYYNAHSPRYSALALTSEDKTYTRTIVVKQLPNQNHVQLYLEHELVAAECTDGVVKSIYIKDLQSGTCTNITADFFVDASGDGVLCRMCAPIKGEEYLCGRDPKTRFNESIAQSDGTLERINEASLFYGIAPEADDSALLAQVASVYAQYDEQGKIVNIVKPDYISGDGYGSRIINPMTGQTSNPYSLLLGKNAKDAYGIPRTPTVFMRNTCSSTGSS